MNLINITEPQNKKSYLCIGVDFGTTNSVCSIKLQNSIKYFKDKYNKTLIPSVILTNDNKKFLVGNEVFEQIDYSEAVYSIKRNFLDNPDKKNFSSKKKNKKLSPVDIAKEIFVHLKEICDSNLDDKVADCVLTVPAYYDEKARSAIMRSALLAGFNVKRLINEPTAAAFAYGLETGKRGNYFVYDLGGGTFDVSILKIKDGIFKVIGTGGDSSLGGDDFDELFARNLVKKNFNISFDDLEKQEKKKGYKTMQTI